MANAPNNDQAKTWKKKTRIGVYVGEPDTAPTEDDLRRDVICTSINIGAGSQLNYATFTVDLGHKNKHIEDREVLSNASRQVEVWTLKDSVEDEDESPRDQCLFWGELLEDSIQIDEGESETWRATIHTPKHFGEPIEGQYTFDRVSDSLTTNHMVIEFNPELDGQVLANKWPATSEQNSKDYGIWIDPEALRTTEAADYQNGGNAALWSLADIVETLFGWKNADEEYIDNPDRDHLDDIIDTDAFDVQNLVYSAGGNIPEYLDMILQPHGYNWYTETKEDSGSSKTTVKLYKRGFGDEKELPLQAYGEDLDPAKTTVSKLKVDYDYRPSRSRLRLVGGLKQLEYTLPLYPAWASSDDGTHDAQDIKNHVGRKFVANEGGSYKGLRLEIGDPPRLTDESGSDIGTPKNRVIEDCLTDRDGQRMPVQVEYRTGGSGAWTDLREIETNWRLLTTEIGIYFTAVGDGALNATILDIDNLELRITGTVTGDYRLEYRTDESTDSPVAGVERIVAVHDRYFYRQRSTVSQVASELTGIADQRDDTTAIEEYAEELLKSETRSAITADVELFGLQFDYQIGDLVTKVYGRAISLNRAAKDADPVYVQVVGITYNLTPDQSTILRVEQYDI